MPLCPFHTCLRLLHLTHGSLIVTPNILWFSDSLVVNYNSIQAHIIISSAALALSQYILCVSAVLLPIVMDPFQQQPASVRQHRQRMQHPELIRGPRHILRAGEPHRPLSSRDPSPSPERPHPRPQLGLRCPACRVGDDAFHSWRVDGSY